MKLAIIDNNAKKVSDYDLKVSGDIRDDVFKKAVQVEATLFRQSYGATPEAGKRQSIHNSKRRKHLRTTYGRGISRTPRKVMWSRGTQFSYKGAHAPHTVGGRRAHPPKAEKIVARDMNNKEWLIALKTGLLASLDAKLIGDNGQKVPTQYPVILDEKVETTLIKTKDVLAFLVSAGLSEELARLAVKKVRAGKGTMRGRLYRIKRGPLFVVSSMEAPLFKALRNVQGIDVVPADMLMVADFGMAEKPGRMVLFTQPALEQFMEVLNN